MTNFGEKLAYIATNEGWCSEQSSQGVLAAGVLGFVARAEDFSMELQTKPPYSTLLRGITGPATNKPHSGDGIVLFQNTRSFHFTFHQLDGVTAVGTPYEWAKDGLESAGVDISLPSDTWIPQFAERYAPLIHQPHAFYQLINTLAESYEDLDLFFHHPELSRGTGVVSTWIRLNTLLSYCYNGSPFGFDKFTQHNTHSNEIEMEKVPGTTGGSMYVEIDKGSGQVKLETIGFADTAVYYLYALRGVVRGKPCRMLGVQRKDIPKNAIFDGHTVDLMRKRWKQQKGKLSFLEIRKELLDQRQFGYTMKRNTRGGVPVCDGSSGFMPRPTGVHTFADELSMLPDLQDSDLVAVIIAGDGSLYHLANQNERKRQQGLRDIMRTMLFGSQAARSELPQTIREHHITTWSNTGLNLRERQSDDITVTTLILKNLDQRFNADTPIVFL